MALMIGETILIILKPITHHQCQTPAAQQNTNAKTVVKDSKLTKLRYIRM
jgi:hypothetical protein